MAQLLEYHTEISVTTADFCEHPFVIDATHAIQVKSINVAIIAPFAGSQHGYAYLWSDAPHYTMMMPSWPNIPATWEKDFGEDYLLLPANTEEQWCLVTQFPGGYPSGLVYDISILYFTQ